MLKALARPRDFVRRHVWSLSFSALAALSFAHLASEIAEGELTPFDRAVATWFQRQHGCCDAVMLAATWYGAFWPLAGTCVAVALFLSLARRRWEAAYVVTCATGSRFFCLALKAFFQRARPDAGSAYLVATPHSFSFPSGHAMGSAGVVGALVVLVVALRAPVAWRVLAAAMGLCLMLGVAASRVYFGVHYASDVIGGQLAAAAWVSAATGWFYPRLLPSEAAIKPDLKAR